MNVRIYRLVKSKVNSKAQTLLASQWRVAITNSFHLRHKAPLRLHGEHAAAARTAPRIDGIERDRT